MNEKARWICHPRDGDQNRLVPVFRKTIFINQGLKEAKLSLSVHGLYEGADQLLPPHSDSDL